MKTIRVMSIIGCAVFVISILCISAWGDTPDNDAALGWGIIGCLYGVALSIVGVIQSSKQDIRRKRR